MNDRVTISVRPYTLADPDDILDEDVKFDLQHKTITITTFVNDTCLFAYARELWIDYPYHKHEFPFNSDMMYAKNKFVAGVGWSFTGMSTLFITSVRGG